VNCPVNVANDAVPDTQVDPDAPANRPVPPVIVSVPLNVMSGPLTMPAPVHVTNNWSPLAAV
jgi:hypothetical protein